jgi:hypothetical protein
MLPRCFWRLKTFYEPSSDLDSQLTLLEKPSLIPKHPSESFDDFACHDVLQVCRAQLPTKTAPDLYNPREKKDSPTPVADDDDAPILHVQPQRDETLRTEAETACPAARHRKLQR